MATIRLTPSTYYLDNTSYLTVADIDNAYENTDSTTYATVTNTRTSTTNYYAYLRGFNFDDVPSGATVNSFSIKLKVREEGASTSSAYQPQICNGTMALDGSGGTMSTSVTTITFTGVTADWETLKSYGSDFGIRVNCRRNNRNTTSYVYLYGAEIEVDYTIPVYHDVTVTNNSQVVSCSPTGTTQVMEGRDFSVSFSGSLSLIDVLDNGTSVKDDISNLSYTIVSVAETHNIVVNDLLFNWVKINGSFKRIRKYYKNQNGTWAEIDKSTFENTIGTSIHFFGGNIDVFISFDISAPSSASAETCICTATYNGRTVYDDVTWEITSGNQYGTIDSSGRITISNSASNSPITVSATYQGHTATAIVYVTYKSGASTSTNTETTENEDGTTTTTTTTVVDNGDGSSTSTSESTTYDENGNVAGSSSNETTNNADGSSESVTTNYDANGNETGHETQNTDTSNNVSTQVVEKDENGNDVVTEYTIDTSGNESGEGMSNEGDGGVDTQFIPFDGSTSWQLDITAYFKYSEQTFVSSEGNHATLVNLMKEVSPWPGMVIRYEQSVGRSLRIIVDGSGARSVSVTEPDDSIYSLRITYQNKTVTVYNKNTESQVGSFSYDLDTFNMSDTTVRLFASYNPDTSSEWRYGTGRILDFSIKKL